MVIPHVLAIPYPAQGHVIPLMEVAQCLAKSGIKVTFVNTDFNHDRVMNSLPRNVHELIDLVSIPDGMEPWEDRNDLGKLTETFVRVMPGKLGSLIEKINATESDKIICVVTDCWLAWALEVAEKFGMKKVAFVPAAVAMSALTLNAQKLIDDGIVDGDGTPLKQDMIRLSPDMPGVHPTNLGWTCVGDFTAQKIIFDFILENNKSSKLADRFICNTSHELEPGALAFVPNCLPIGPLLAHSRQGNQAGYFWPEDSACLEWLNQQPANSVIYVAFGSFTVFDQTQFQELALGLELTERTFLWVVRPDITEDSEKSYPLGFRERVKNRGKMVGWAPQQEVLSHPSVSCFLSHCGWNSTIEGLSNGVPFLCWPYFADQFLNQSYICEEWEIGLGFDKDKSGIVGREEIKYKVDQLLTDGKFKKRALELKGKVMKGVGEEGRSQKNFQDFLDWIKGK